MKTIVLKVSGSDFTLVDSPDGLHLAFYYVARAISGHWKVELIRYGSDNGSFWYNFRDTDGDLLYQIRILV